MGAVAVLGGIWEIVFCAGPQRARPIVREGEPEMAGLHGGTESPFAARDAVHRGQTGGAWGRMSDLSGNSLSVPKRRAKPIQLAPWTSAIAGSVDWTSLGDDAMGDIQVFAGATSEEALRQRLHGEVEAEVAAMLDAIKGFDAFDVIELLRLREIPGRPGRRPDGRP